MPVYRPSLLNATVAQRGETPAASGPAAGGVSLRVGPNPFRGQTHFAISLPKSAVVSLKVYSVLGQRVATVAEGPFAAGEHAATLRADKLPAGIYYAILRVGGQSFRKTLILEP